LAALATAWALPARPAQGQAVGPVEVVPLPQPIASSSDASLYGYVEHRVRLTNRAGENRTISLAAPTLSTMPSPGPYVSKLRRNVTLAPGATTIVRFYQPALPMPSEDLDVRVLPDNERATIYLHGADHCDSIFVSGPQEYSLSCLLTPGVATETQRSLGFGLTGRGNHRPEDLAVHRWESDLAELSPSWLAYTRFDLIVVEADEVPRIPAEARQAIIGHVQTGGNLLVNVRSHREVAPLRRLLGLPPGAEPAESCGFGMVGFAKIDNRPITDAFASVEDVLDATKGRARFRTSERQANPDRTLPVVEDLSVPVVGLFVIMLGFVVLIGPVNYLVLSAWNRRGLLLVTVPAISLVTCGLVLLYSLLSEGLTIKERTVAVTVLDERTHRAATVGWAGFYAPMAPGNGLRFDYDTEVTPLIDLYGPESRGYSIDWTSDQHLYAGWVQSRVPLHMVLRRWQLRRERLTARTGPDGTVRVVNGLGATIRRLWLADGQGQIHQAGPISPGAEAGLGPTGQRVGRGKAAASMGNLLRRSASGPIQLAKRLIGQPGLSLRPGTYVALLEDTPFLETGMDAGERDVKSVVFGIMAGSDSPEGSTNGR
jgi:hypothetical protein